MRLVCGLKAPFFSGDSYSDAHHLAPSWANLALGKAVVSDGEVSFWITGFLLYFAMAHAQLYTLSFPAFLPKILKLQKL
jgi:hypothetical protein